MFPLFIFFAISDVKATVEADDGFLSLASFQFKRE